MNIRHVQREDYVQISPLINEWWGGRQMADMLPRLFFEHFTDTSFIAEKDGEIIGFLIGFVSQSHEKEAYIHFVGVHPKHRGVSVGNTLYTTFFEKVRGMGRNTIRCVTSPVNKGSIAYHRKMGFDVVKGDEEVDDVSVHTNYDGTNQGRVLFKKII
ncbi:N-acetyltransferase family protein [Bacillus spongiae]|uniref:GNAT family N-acetyltransferase n=1 Tax=Bacillus spongiae TaxID=2683610 RepID=UPI003AF90FBB